jgi:L-amino acid N-acyltransferase YncA
MISNVKRKLKESGYTGVLLSALRRTKIFRYFVIYYFYRVELKAIKPIIHVPFNIHTDIFEDLDGVESLNQIQEKEDIFSNRLSQGDKFAVVVYVDNIPVGYVWGDLAPIHFEEMYEFEFPLAAADVYCFDSYIDPEFRGMGLNKYLFNSFIEHAMSTHNRTFMIAFIAIDNQKSVAIHEGMGFLRQYLNFSFCISNKKLNFRIKSYVE